MIKLHDAQSFGDSSARSEGAGVFTQPGSFATHARVASDPLTSATLPNRTRNLGLVRGEDEPTVSYEIERPPFVFNNIAPWATEAPRMVRPAGSGAGPSLLAADQL